MGRNWNCCDCQILKIKTGNYGSSSIIFQIGCEMHYRSCSDQNKFIDSETKGTIQNEFTDQKSIKIKKIKSNQD